MKACLAWEYTFCVLNGVVGRDEGGVSNRPASRTRCFGVLGVGRSKASLKRTVDGVETVVVGVFSSRACFSVTSDVND